MSREFDIVYGSLPASRAHDSLISLLGPVGKDIKDHGRSVSGEQIFHSVDMLMRAYHMKLPAVHTLLGLCVGDASVEKGIIQGNYKQVKAAKRNFSATLVDKDVPAVDALSQFGDISCVSSDVFEYLESYQGPGYELCTISSVEYLFRADSLFGAGHIQFMQQIDLFIRLSAKAVKAGGHLISFMAIPSGYTEAIENTGLWVCKITSPGNLYILQRAE